MLKLNAIEAHWAITFHTFSHSPRAKRWFRISRLVFVDGRIFELYWHANIEARGSSLVNIRKAARAAKVNLLPGTYTRASYPHNGSEMERAS